MLDINKEVIEEIRARCDIVDIVTSSGVQLKHGGSNDFKGLCPFHQEKTPSFHVNTARQSFHCFGCGKGGDVFRYFMDKENIDFYTAAQLLASRCGVIIPEKSSSFKDRRPAVDRNQKERLWEINGVFSDFFCDYRRKFPDSPAAVYLRERGIPDEIADRFHIGAAPDDWSACVDYGRRMHFTDEEMLTAGIIRRKEETGHLYDQFKGRLVFTIENELGKPVGFSARTLEPKPQDGRKYVNTQETPVFHKGFLLYALPQARQGIGRWKQAILCEGQLDAIAFHRAGVDCAVAPLGTAFTADQARIIRRYSRNLILAFDADGAGRKAVLRAAEILLPLSVDLKVLKIPGGKDPDELYRNQGPEALKAALANTVPWLEVLQESLTEQFDLSSPAGRAQAAAATCNLLKLVNDQVELEVYVQQAAAMLKISENSLLAELDSVRGKSRPMPPAETAVPNRTRTVNPDRTKQAPALRTLLELSLNDPDTGRRLAELLPPELLDGKSPLEQALNLAIETALNDEPETLPERLKDLLLTSPCAEISGMLVKPTEFINKERALQESIAELKRLDRQAKETRILQALPNAATEEEQLELLRQLKNLAEEGEIS